MKRILSLFALVLVCSASFMQCKKKHVSNDICDCAASESSFVVDTITLTVPNIFTPNGDLKNDVWKINNIEKFPDCKIKITRPGLLGGIVFESTGYGGNQYWDGGKKNIDQGYKDGKYKYEIIIGDKIFSGFVCIVRGLIEPDNRECIESCLVIDQGDPILY
jgi:gliding motility-associated-like protein